MTAFGDAAQTLLSCLDTALHDRPNPPGEICLRVGQVPFSVGLNEDLCCTGLAWVRITRIFPSVNFPNPDTRPDDCITSSRAVEFEMGVVRCLPDHGEVSGATCDEWTATFMQVDEDSGAMRVALCCFSDMLGVGNFLGEQLVEGEWTPIDGQGGCIGGMMTVTALIQCSEC